MRKRTVAKVGIAVVFVLAIAALAVYCRQRFVIPVLMYHSVRSPVAAGDLLTVSAGTFERQMRFLSERRYKVLPLDRAAALIAAGKKPAKTVCITFDDGYEDNFTVAFPILLKYRIPATVFVIVSQVGTPGYLSWEQVRQMRDSGLVSFGSHTLSHRALTTVGKDERVEEIRGSKRLLEEKLGEPVTMFSYPIGAFDDKIRGEVVSAGYTVAVATNPGRAVRDDDIFAIKRLKISEKAANLFVFSFEASGYYNLVRESKKKKSKKQKIDAVD